MFCLISFIDFSKYWLILIVMQQQVSNELGEDQQKDQKSCEMLQKDLLRTIHNQQVHR